MGRPLTNICVSCRKSKTVIGPRVRSNTSLKLSAVNSPPPEARRSVKPVFVGSFWSLFASSGSSVVRKFRGRLLASFRSISEINTGESASAGRTGGFFCTSVAEKVNAGLRSETDSTYRTADGRDMRFLTRQLHAHAFEEARNFSQSVFISFDQ